MTAVGKGVADGYLSPDELDAIARDGLGALPVDGRRVLVIIPDGTRTMPMPLMFGLIERELGARVAALDFLVALGTHTPMTDSQLTAHVGRTARRAHPKTARLRKRQGPEFAQRVSGDSPAQAQA